MLGAHLAIDEAHVPAREPLHRADERDLRRVGPVREHRLAEEGAAERDAVEPARERFALPRLERVREPEPMQPLVRVDHLRHDPGAVLIRPLARRATPDHLIERAVRGDPVAAAADRAPERGGDVQPFRLEDEARIGGPPEDRRVVAIPGEDPRGVGGEEPLGREIPADREQPVGLGLLRIRERHLSRQPVDRHAASVVRGRGAANGRAIAPRGS